MAGGFIRVEVVKARVPNLKFWRDSLQFGLKEEGKIAAGEMAQFFQTWEGKPRITSKIVKTKDYVAIDITLSGDEGILNIVDWVIFGTEGPYPIPKQPKPYPLRYPGTFTPKTQPGVLQSQAGFEGPPIHIAKEVMHPGIRARNTYAIIIEKHKGKFYRRMLKHSARGLKNAILRGRVT